MKRKNTNIATGVAIGMAVGAALGVVGATQVPNMMNSKMMRKTKKAIKRNTDKAMLGIESLMSNISKMR